MNKLAKYLNLITHYTKGILKKNKKNIFKINYLFK